jgi:hypothetical protein
MGKDEKPSSRKSIEARSETSDVSSSPSQDCSRAACEMGEGQEGCLEGEAKTEVEQTSKFASSILVCTQMPSKFFSSLYAYLK